MYLSPCAALLITVAGLGGVGGCASSLNKANANAALPEATRATAAPDGVCAVRDDPEPDAACPACASRPDEDIKPASSEDRLAHEENVITVFRRLAPATVHVTVKRRGGELAFSELEVPLGSGTGFIWDTRGHIVTNFHVVDGAATNGVYLVTLYSGKTYEATLLGGDPNKDVAVLRLRRPPRDLTPVLLAPNERAMAVGQTAIAIGNPFGLDHTLTTGVVSALGRDVPGYGGVTIRDMIQTDASINPGNSGGPLLDSRGYLIGMNTMILSRSGGSAGIGFAVPAATIRRVVTQLVETGRIASPGIGVVPLPDEMAARIGIEGVAIKSIVPDSPAARIGLRGIHSDDSGNVFYGDVILSVDRTPVRTYDDLYNALDQHQVGDEVVLRIRRKTKLLDLRVKLADQAA